MEPDNSSMLVTSEEESILMQTVEDIVNKNPNQTEIVEEVGRYFLVSNVSDEREGRIVNTTSSNPNFTSNESSPWSEMCRVCANVSDHLIPIFQGEGADHDLCSKIHKYLPIHISVTDTLPTQLCYHCAATILAWYELLEGCLNAQHHLLQIQANIQQKQEYISSSNIEEANSTRLTTTEDCIVTNQPQLESKENNQEVSKKAGLEHSDSNDHDRSDRVQTPFKVFLDTQSVNWKSLKKASPSLCKKQTIEEDSDSIWIAVINSNLGHDSPATNSRLDSKLDDQDSKQKLPEEKRKEKKDAESTKSQKETTEVQETYQCEECGRGFKLKDSYLRHMRIHKDERPFTCHVCGKQFRDSGGLSRHLKDVHAKLKNFSCDICGNSFASKATRDDHRRTHTGERPYVCDSCGKTFKSKASLYIHSKLHTDEFPHPCTYCNKKFRRRQEMLAHVTTHTGEKNYLCTICLKRFRVKSELVRHQLVHSKDKPFACITCGLAFRQKRYLNNHVKSIHIESSKNC